LSSSGATPGPAARSEAAGYHRLLTEHPALALTLGYLLISLLGLSYQWTLFRQFDVNFFLYAEVTDFLMGAFREPITFALSLSALAVAWLVSVYSRWEARWWERHPPTNVFTRAYARFTTAGFNRYLPAAFFIGYSVMFIWVYAGKRADELKAGIGHGIRLEVAEGQARRPSPGSPTLMMGTSARFVFLYRPDDDLVEIVPHENILRLVIEAPPAAQPPAAPAPTRRTEP
jgi:hypothetical protein